MKMKRFLEILLPLLLSPLWLFGYFAQVVWSIVASGWIAADEAMMDRHKTRPSR